MRYRSQELARLILPQSRYSYDILVYIGKEIFLHSRNETQILGQLLHRGIEISRSQVVYLAKKFIVTLSIVHKQSSPAMKEKMRLRGGYILHLDGTSEDDSPHLMSILDGISQIVLDNIKIPSENAGDLIPFLKRVKQRFGTPIATVHDMGKAIINAMCIVFKGVRDFICHFHFLRDIGKDLFGKENDAIRKRLSKKAIQGFLCKQASSLKEFSETDVQLLSYFENMVQQKSTMTGPHYYDIKPDIIAYLLINWALEGKRVGNGYGFPFDRPCLSFYLRLKIVYSAISELRYTVVDHTGKKKKLLGKIWKKIGDTIHDPILKNQARCMQKKVDVFDRLRNAMRIALPEGKNGLNDKGECEKDMESIENKVIKFQTWLENSKLCEKDIAYKKMYGQIEKYWSKLFADPIVKKTKTGPVTIYPQRTNNILERFFRDLRRTYRKKSGNNSLSKTLKAMIADTPLVKNLENPEYLKTILDGSKTLEERFAQINSQLVRQEMLRVEEENRKMHPKIRKIIKSETLPDKLVKMFHKCQ